MTIMPGAAGFHRERPGRQFAAVRGAGGV